MALRDRLRLLWLALTMKPIAGAEDPDPDPEDPEKDDPKDPDPADPKDPEKDDPKDPDKVDPDDDWKAKARKHERAAKREREAREKAEKELKDRQKEDLSEQEKKIEEAKEKAREEAKAESDAERRKDRLEVAVTRIAAKGVQQGEGDDAKTVRFDDPEDALVFIERQIDNGDLDADEIFDDDGKVNADAVTEALQDLLKRKPRLAADAEGQKPGDADTRKGDPAKGDMEAMSAEDHAKRKHGKDK